MTCNAAGVIHATVMNYGAAYVVAVTAVDCCSAAIVVGTSVDFCALIDDFAKMTLALGAAVLNNNPALVIATPMYHHATAVLVLPQSVEQHAVVAVLAVTPLVVMSTENICRLLGRQGWFSFLHTSSPTSELVNFSTKISSYRKAIKVVISKTYIFRKIHPLQM